MKKPRKLDTGLFQKAKKEEELEMKILEDDESCSYKFSQLGLGLINYSFKCVQGDYIGKSFRLLHIEDG